MSVMEDFIVLVLGRTCLEWEGRLGDSSGRAGFNDFGSPLDVVSSIERFHDGLEVEGGGCPRHVFDVGALQRSTRVVLCLVDVCQV